MFNVGAGARPALWTLAVLEWLVFVTVVGWIGWVSAYGGGRRLRDKG